MLTISKPLSDWSREQQGHSEWQGKLAQEWGLQGGVGAEQFARLTEGQHPENQEQMVRHQPAKTYENQFGREVTSVEHRAGWDATFFSSDVGIAHCPEVMGGILWRAFRKPKSGLEEQKRFRLCNGGRRADWVREADFLVLIRQTSYWVVYHLIHS